MTDHDALVRAVCASPDDDTPRLVLADYLDDHGDPDRAAFVRAQVELARTLAWEPFAVLCRHRRTDWLTGDPFRHTLPRLPVAAGVYWHQWPFRRGLGWQAVIGSLPAWVRLATEGLFERVPVGEVHLRAPATLDEWRGFARGPGIHRLRAVHLVSGSPVEPVRVLAATPAAGITALHFHASTSPGLPTLLDDLFATPLGRNLRRLTCRLGGGQTGFAEDLVDALTADGAGFDRLALPIMYFGPPLLRRWCDRGGPRRLTGLDLTDNYGVGNDGVRVLADGLRGGAGLHTLRLANCGIGEEGVKTLAEAEDAAGLRLLDLSRNPLSAKAARFLAGSPHLAGLRSLNLASCRLGDAAVRHLTKATFWPNLVELDLRGNHINEVGAGHLLKAAVPPDLTALVLDAGRLGSKAAGRLRQHFGDRLVLV